jgi:para-nitrobenzyl esterase
METEASLSEELKTESSRAEYLWDSAIDKQFLTDAPVNIFGAGKQNPVPVITSANLGELTGPGMIVAPYLVPEYVNMLNGVSKAGQKGYACIFDRVPGKWKQEGCVSFHGLEVVYVFGSYDIYASRASAAFPFIKSAGAKSPDPGISDVDRKVSENMMAMWAQFTRTGNPNVKGLITPPAYDSAADQYLYIADPLQVKSGFSKVAQKK